MVFSKKLILSIVVVLISLTSSAQFVYLGTGFQYNWLRFQGGYDENLSIRGMNLPLTLGVRPARFIEINLGISPSLRSKTKFSFKNDRNVNPNNTSSTSYGGHYKATEYDYQISREVKFTLAAKLFFESNLNSYFELGISSQDITEEFIFKRPARAATFYSFGGLQYGALPEKNFTYSKTNSLIAPTLALGMKPHISDRVYFDLKIITEFISLPEDAFSISVENDWDFSEDRHNFLELTSMGTGSSVFLSGEIGFGIFF